MTKILFTVDGLSKPRIGRYRHDERDVTPFIDDLFADNLEFTNAYSASSHTREALPSLLTGSYPWNSLKGLRVGTSYTIEKPTIAEYFDRSKACIAGPFLTRSNNYDRGFEEFYNGYSMDKRGLLTGASYIWRILRNRQFKDGSELVEKTVKDYQRFDFIWIHLQDLHMPYTYFDEWYYGEEISTRKLQYISRKAKHFPDKLCKEEEKTLKDAYDNCLRKIDGLVEKFWKKCGKDKGVEVYFTSDHGQYFGQNNRYGHKKRLDEELLEIPLFVKKNSVRGRCTEKVSIVDLAPTIIDDRSKKFEGRDILNGSDETEIKAGVRRFFHDKRRVIN